MWKESQKWRTFWTMGVCNPRATISSLYGLHGFSEPSSFWHPHIPIGWWKANLKSPKIPTVDCHITPNTECFIISTSDCADTCSHVSLAAHYFDKSQNVMFLVLVFLYLMRFVLHSSVYYIFYLLFHVIFNLCFFVTAYVEWSIFFSSTLPHGYNDEKCLNKYTRNIQTHIQHHSLVKMWGCEKETGGGCKSKAIVIIHKLEIFRPLIFFPCSNLSL